MQNCSRCGQPCEDGTVYCTHCGEQLPQPPQGTEAQPAEAPEIPQAAEEAATETYQAADSAPDPEQPQSEAGFFGAPEQPAADAPEQPEAPVYSAPEQPFAADDAAAQQPFADGYAAPDPTAGASADPGDGYTADDSGEQPQDAGQQPGQIKSTYCFKCGNKLPESASFCAVCGSKVAQVAASEEIIPVSEPYYSAPDYGIDEAPKKKSRKGLIAVICAVAVLVVAGGVFAAVQLMGGIGVTGGKVSDDVPLVYVQDGDTLKYKNATMENSEVITNSYDVQSSDYSYYSVRYELSHLSPDGRYLLYLNDYRQQEYYGSGKGDLFVRDLTVHPGENEPIEKGTKIASDVTSDFYFSGNSEYVFYIDTKNDLYAWDFEQAYKIDSDVAGFYDWNDDTVLYYKGDEVDYYTSYYTTRDIYLSSLEYGSSGRNKVDTDVSDLWDWTPEFDKFIYTKTTKSDSAAGLFDIYWYDVANDKKDTIMTDVDDLVDCNAEDGSVMYLLSQPASLKLSDVIDDDMLEEDRDMTEPSYDDYPTLKQFADEYGDYFYYYYYWYYYDDIDIDMDALERELEEYEKAEEKYSQKGQRDRLREEIEKDLSSYSDYDVEFYELYYYSSEAREKIKIDDSIYRTSYTYTTDARGNVDDGYAYYIRVDLKGIDKLKMSELDLSYYYFFSIDSYLDELMQGELYFSFIGEDSQRLTKKSDDANPSTYGLMVTEDLDGIYYTTQAKDTSESLSSSYGSYSSSYSYSYYPDMNLYYVPVEGRSLGEPVKVDDAAVQFGYQRYKGHYYYLSNLKDWNCDVYTVTQGERERLGYDVSFYDEPRVYNGGETILFFENYDDNREMGELYYVNTEKIKVADDVYEYFYRADDLIYVLRNYRSGKGDLYLYNGESLVLVDYDVTDILYIAGKYENEAE